ncbi:hypothetical protein [Paraburkholderia domus]|uniref:hypothetical protein n=1 Tax=Paraburkholderia domus TaxID=2793075 RepID=UPI001B116F1E|nr:hypothetical protein [Paraburkholderia domus]CAE6811662.1 hypothetical protein R75483_05822 [Paraburkholderia domus]
MSNISLLKAFSILLNGSDYQIGEGYRWKRGVLSTAVALTVAFPLFNLAFSQSYMGAVPPEAPLVRSVGNFTVGNFNRRSINRQRAIDFHAANGKVYQLLDNSLDISKIGKANSGVNFYVEGFLLQDGRGFFWPTLISEVDGHVLLGREESNRSLDFNREPFGKKRLLWEYGLIIPLWLISLFNATKLRKKFPETIK